MKLVLGGESLIGPRTGIGTYTYQLARHLEKSPEIEQLSFLVHGKLLPARTLLREHELGEHPDNPDSMHSQPPVHQAMVERLLAGVRGVAARNRTAVYLYGQLIPYLERWSLRNFQPDDVIHSPNYMLPSGKGRMVVTIPDLSTVIYPEYHPRARVDYINRHIEMAVDRADHILTISNRVKQEICERYTVEEERISTTYLGIDESFRPVSEPEFQSVASRYGLTYNQYFLFVSTIEPRKNLDRLLDAYEAYRAVEKSNSLPLVVVGLRGWSCEATMARLQKLNERGIVKHLGYVEQGDLQTLMAGARALTFISMYEGFGLPVVEAMQAGTPVLTSTDSAMEEIAGEAALLISPHDTDGICTKLLQLANDDILTAELTRKGLAVAGTLSWESCAQQTLAAYKRSQTL